jgi:hypothetical protein
MFMNWLRFERPETVDHLGRKPFDLGLVFEHVGETPVERQPHIEVGDIISGISTGMPILICGVH